jgi:hypothetical protein
MSVSDYKFNNMSNLLEDSCTLSQRNVQNSSASTYMTQNFYPACPMGKAIDFATQQPNVFYNGSHQVGINGCNIDTNSELKLSKISKPPCRINLLERPYLTVPYLGRGQSNVILEAQLQQGDQIVNKKSVNPSSEVSYLNYSNYPLIPEIEQNVTNPNNLIESEAAAGWIRGGLPSREYARDNSNTCNN